MKIIQTPPRFYPYIGGTEQLTFYLCKELVKKGHYVKIICANEPEVGDGVIEGMEVRRLPYIGKIANTNITIPLLMELMKDDFDVIHTYFPHPWSADMSALVGLMKNKPLFLTYNNDITGKGINKLIANTYNFICLRFLLKRPNKIFITHENYLKTSPFLEPFKDKIVITPPGVDMDRFKPLNLPKNEENIIFFLSRLDRFHLYKGLEFLLKAIKRIAHEIPLKLYVGGEGELIYDYKRFVKENGIEEKVVFLGRLDNEQLIKYYNLCDIFVLPSISSTQEGFGLVALEAMACKKPVIVTDIVGVAENVKRYKAGIVIPPKDIELLSEGIEYLLLNKDKAEEMGFNAYHLVKNSYTWQKHAQIVEEEYLKTIDHRP